MNSLKSIRLYQGAIVLLLTCIACILVLNPRQSALLKDIDVSGMNPGPSIVSPVDGTGVEIPSLTLTNENEEVRVLRELGFSPTQGHPISIK